MAIDWGWALGGRDSRGEWRGAGNIQTFPQIIKWILSNDDLVMVYLRDAEPGCTTSYEGKPYEVIAALEPLGQDISKRLGAEPCSLCGGPTDEVSTGGPRERWYLCSVCVGSAEAERRGFSEDSLSEKGGAS